VAAFTAAALVAVPVATASGNSSNANTRYQDFTYTFNGSRTCDFVRASP
jgi:hypothetical protein